ncbi:polynucleotide adenylyltransferase PcnB [Candidatus Pseudomonas adelgestsugas]|uniref:Poly(A) polymerase I n=1 Tax=Candidatus Pseudomonas adelgestsugas TaxID=1302376 RepID=A0ABX5R8P0_9PSED|nr:polynucleotide adenylyltransferase PcnB [Candidatus Pseudomonas adelgestsugas]QAX81734.1 Poly(A) polymerase I precursor [Candidatus Pseudomonas adelgestsugas]
MLKKLFQSFRYPLRYTQHIQGTPKVLNSDQHSLERAKFSRYAVNIIERLQNAGYQAYLVGGCVRDMLLNITPKDFDVATSATPEQIRNEFRNARIIGRRFKLVHIHFGREIIEVATFRAHHPQNYEAANTNQSSRNESGRILRDNVYGTLEEDAQRRDFTINALYYDPVSNHILDYDNGIHDIRNNLICLIGDPMQRYQEDPVRMLRAVRFAAKLNFGIEKHTAAPIHNLAPMLREIPSARLFEEVLKMFLSGYAANTFKILVDLQLFDPLFRASAEALKYNPIYTHTLISEALIRTDLRIKQNKSVTPAFLFAALLWPALLMRALRLQERGMLPKLAMQEAAHKLIIEQCQHITIPKRFTMLIREIWNIQERMLYRSGKRADLLLNNPRFRASYDFLLLRESAGEQTGGLGEWWTNYQNANDSQRRNMIHNLDSKRDRVGDDLKKRCSNNTKRRHSSINAAGAASE